MFLKRLSRGLSIRTRLTLLFVTIFGSTLVLFGIVTFDFLSTSLLKEFDDALYNYAVDVSEGVVLNPAGDLAVSSANVDQAKIYPFSLGTALIQIRHINGTVLSQFGNFGNLNLPYKKDFQKLAKGEETTFGTITKLEGLPNKEAPSYRVVSFPLDNSPVPQLILQIAVPLAFVDTQIHNRRILFETAIPLIILISTLASFFLSSRALAPVQDIVQKANDIGATQLSHRLPVPEAKDEVRSLALTLNEMLGRIEQAFQSQERFVADASHQLLTPLTIMKGELEQTLKTTIIGSDDKKTMSSTLSSTLQEVDHLISLVKNLLVLARVDAGLGAMNLQELYFDEIILDAISRSEKLARAKEIRLKFDIRNRSGREDLHPKIKGDEDLLQNLVFNLLENAIKYSDNSTSVAVELEWNASEQTLRVQDQGPGIPENQLDTIFDRFSRAQNVGRKVDGYGLGLAIASKIALSHHAELIAKNRKDGPGAEFELKIKNI
jgi:signal transduction histidine kinase